MLYVLLPTLSKPVFHYYVVLFLVCIFFFFKVSESTYLIIEGFWSMLTKAFHTSKLTFSYILFAVFIFQGYNWNLLYYER